MIIGKGGNYIKQIKEQSGSYVQISQKAKELSLQERCITVVGEYTVPIYREEFLPKSRSFSAVVSIEISPIKVWCLFGEIPRSIESLHNYDLCLCTCDEKMGSYVLFVTSYDVSGSIDSIDQLPYRDELIRKHYKKFSSFE